jgi:hypothetical protein
MPQVCGMDYNWSKKKPAPASIFVSLIIHRSETSLAAGHNRFTLDHPACSVAFCELHLAQRQEIH